jgi:hypothetical protein
VSRARNADEFLLRFREICNDYAQIFGPRLAEIRRTYAANPGGKVPPPIDDSLQ